MHLDRQNAQLGTKHGVHCRLTMGLMIGTTCLCSNFGFTRLAEKRDFYRYWLLVLFEPNETSHESKSLSCSMRIRYIHGKTSRARPICWGQFQLHCFPQWDTTTLYTCGPWVGVHNLHKTLFDSCAEKLASAAKTGGTGAKHMERLH